MCRFWLAKNWTLSLLLLGGPGAEALAQQAHYDKTWAEINQYSPVENFHSRGSFGWNVGVGVLQTKHSDEQAADSEPVSPAPREESPGRIPRITLSKGTRWPLDFGLTLARLSETSQAWQAGGHVQWTLVESFQLPSLALRVSRLETQGLRDVSRLRSDTVQIGSSYALIRYITLSASVGMQWQSWQWKDSDEVLSLTAWEEEARDEKYQIYTWGVRVHPFSPFISLGYEQVRWGVDHLTHHAQLSILL